MSRLIDADALIEEIANMDISEQSKIFSVNMLRYTPTAYDISKVVEELEAKENEWWDTYSLSSGFDEYAHGKSVGFEEAIDIVKAGGVE